MAVPYTFGSATASIPLSQLDSNFATTITLGNTAIQLGNTVTTLNNMTLANVTISSGTSNLAATAITNGTSNVAIASSGGNIAMATNGATAITIDTSQKVGIGTSSPNAKLNVVASSGSTGFRMDGGLAAFYPSSATGNQGLQVDTTNLAVGSNALFVNMPTSWTGNIISANLNGVQQFSVSQAGIGYYLGNLLLGGRTSAPYGETLSIATANNQGIHINDTASSSNINYQYFTKGAGLTNVGAIYYNGSVMAYQTTSDYRLKENVAPITNALNKINLLKPVTYTWKDNQQSGEGFLAHELQEHFSDAVSGTKDGVDENGKPKYQGMDASVLIASMVKAIQELKAINDTQAETINALTARIVALEAK